MADSVKDPVCGKMIDPSSSMCQGDYCFCSEDCRNKFIVNPGRYMSNRSGSQG